jgi:hypothetical protein
VPVASVGLFFHPFYPERPWQQFGGLATNQLVTVDEVHGIVPADK